MAEARAFPSSRESQEALLGAIIQGGASIYEKVTGWIREKDAFHFTENQIVWIAITKLFKEHEAIDEITILSKIKGILNGRSKSVPFKQGIRRSSSWSNNSRRSINI